MDESKGLTPVQFAALAAINDNPGIGATRLSQLIFFDRATIGNVLERLERNGLISRSAHHTDKRAKQVYLTKAGAQQLEKMEEVIPNIARRIYGPLNEAERQEMMRLLAKVLEGRPDPGNHGDHM